MTVQLDYPAEFAALQRKHEALRRHAYDLEAWIALQTLTTNQIIVDQARVMFPDLSDGDLAQVVISAKYPTPTDDLVAVTVKLGPTRKVTIDFSPDHPALKLSPEELEKDVLRRVARDIRDKGHRF